MLQRGFDYALYIIIVTAALIDAILAFDERQHVAVLIRQPQLIDVFRKSPRHAVRISLVFLGQAAAGIAHVPFVGFVGHVQVGDGAPAHAALHGVAFGHDGSDGFQIRLIQSAVARHADQSALRSAAAHAQGKDAVHIARQEVLVVAGITYRCLKVSDHGGRSGVTAAGACEYHDHAGACILRNAPIAHRAGVVGWRGHGGIAGRIHRNYQRRGEGGVLPGSARLIHRAGIGSIAVIRRREISARNKYAHGFIAAVSRGSSVG